jgi:ribonuclease T1
MPYPPAGGRRAEPSARRQCYLPWGGLRYEWGVEVHTGRLFTGQVLEASVGLYYYGARWYDQALGRWISPDTIIPQSGNPQSLNRYSYALNAPMTLVDPSGHYPGQPVMHDYDDYSSSPLVDLVNVRVQDNPTCPTCSTASIDYGAWMRSHPGYSAEHDVLLAAVQTRLKETGTAYGVTPQDIFDVNLQAGLYQLATGKEDIGEFAASALMNLGPAAFAGGLAAVRLGEAQSMALPFKDMGLSARVAGTIESIDQGGPFPYAKDGSVWRNEGGQLPDQPAGYYREYTVPNPAISGRWVERLVAGQAGEIYYTPNHYGSFVQIR